MNELASAITAMRQWARDEIAIGTDMAEVHRKLCVALDAIETEFRIEFDVPGVNYYEVYDENNAQIGFASLRPGEVVPVNFRRCVDKEPRYEFLARQGLAFGYENRL